MVDRSGGCLACDPRSAGRATPQVVAPRDGRSGFLTATRLVRASRRVRDPAEARHAMIVAAGAAERKVAGTAFKLGSKRMRTFWSGTAAISASRPGKPRVRLLCASSFGSTLSGSLLARASKSETTTIRGVPKNVVIPMAETIRSTVISRPSSQEVFEPSGSISAAIARADSCASSRSGPWMK